MNISMNIDCSPEEARRLMGLPDLTPVHELYLSKMREMIGGGGMTPDMFDQVMRNWSPVGDFGVHAWKQMVDQLTGGAPKT